MPHVHQAGQDGIQADQQTGMYANVIATFDLHDYMQLDSSTS